MSSFSLFVHPFRFDFFVFKSIPENTIAFQICYFLLIVPALYLYYFVFAIVHIFVIHAAI